MTSVEEGLLDRAAIIDAIA